MEYIWIMLFFLSIKLKHMVSMINSDHFDKINSLLFWINKSI